MNPLNNIPTELHGMYARYAIDETQAREKADREAREARMKHEQQVKESVAAIEAESKKRQEREAEQAAKKKRARFEAELQKQFLDANPGYDVLDWDQHKKRIIADALVARTSGEEVDEAKKRLRASGRYSF